MNAKTMSIAPQALVLEGLGDFPGEYVTAINRSSIPFGLARPVQVKLPEDEVWKDKALQTIDVTARYPAQETSSRQQKFSLTKSVGSAAVGEDPFPFQYDEKGSTEIEYTVNYVFDASSDWRSKSSRFSYDGKMEGNAINPMPAEALDFTRIEVRLNQDFYWDEADQVVVTLTSERWQGEEIVVIQNGQPSSRNIRVRSGIETMEKDIIYNVSVRRNNRPVYEYGPEKLTGPLITIHDQFGSHIPVSFTANFTVAKSADITLSYEDGEYYWDEILNVESGKQVDCVVPVPSELSRKEQRQIRFDCEIELDDGRSVKIEAKRGVNAINDRTFS
jgi:hypothetical protein